MSDKARAPEGAQFPSSPDELVKELDVQVTESEASQVTGGSKVELEYRPVKPAGTLSDSVTFGQNYSK